MEKDKKAILVVDEENYLTELFKTILEKDRVVYTANDSQSALALFEEKREEIGLVIMEMTMKRMSSADIFLYFKKERPELKVLVTIASFDPGTFKVVSNDEHVDFIQKPFNQETLVKKVEKLL